MKINIRYVPRKLTKKDKLKQLKEILKSQKAYKKKKYYTRKQIKSFSSKKSKHIINAQKIYNVEKIIPSNELSSATGCSKKSLEQIVNKGEGAYYSSGSRPNQTAQSWGYARLASALTSGKAASVDFNILQTGCKKNSLALKLAKKAVKKYGLRTRKAPKVNINIK